MSDAIVNIVLIAVIVGVSALAVFALYSYLFIDWGEEMNDLHKKGVKIWDDLITNPLMDAWNYLTGNNNNNKKSTSELANEVIAGAPTSTKTKEEYEYIYSAIENGSGYAL